MGVGHVRIKSVHVRFYRAFNYDFLAKPRGTTPHAWDRLDGDLVYPYVTVDLDDAVTCVVGANESGKSQLLQAMEHALTGADIEPSDFCRYSRFFAVDAALRLPHFGLTLTDLSDADRTAVIAAVSPDATTSFDNVHLFREAESDLLVYLDDIGPTKVSTNALASMLPQSFRIDPEIPIPNSVPIAYLAAGERAATTVGPDRQERFGVFDAVVGEWSVLRTALAAADQLSALASKVFGGVSPGDPAGREADERAQQLALAYDLLVTVGGVEPSVFGQLERALRRQDEGFADGIVSTINAQLAKSLNLRKWWSQDDQFRLEVTAHDYDLVFTVRDRTASAYSFAERSSGLKYFLSYLVQYLARVAQPDCPEVLLMDEPDAFLSNQGQQDLLKLFHDFTGDPSHDRQVVFVTHSPFLIDKNRADRIRVLDKGTGEEGTRVVRNVGHNHFEPLRSALGGFVAETTFIGNCNLMLEGVSDQIYLAGLSAVLRERGRASAERLDLNTLTLVPAGSASHVPYMVFLARGRDADQPAVIVLLDGDSEGANARKDLERGGPRRKQLLAPEFVLQLNPVDLPTLKTQRPDGVVDIEDLVPIELGLAAARSYLEELSYEVPDPFPVAADVEVHLSKKVGLLGAIQKVLDGVGAGLNLEKIGFARHVVDMARQGVSGTEGLVDNFAILFARLGEMQRAAERKRSQAGVGSRVQRLRDAFLQDHPTSASRSDVSVLLEDIEARLDDTLESDRLLVDIRRIREEWVLAGELASVVEHFPALVTRLETLQYQGVLQSEPGALGADDSAS